MSGAVKNKKDWTKKEIGLLGSKPDRVVAEMTGKHISTVRNKRVSLNIDPARKWSAVLADKWTEEEKNLLGVYTDKVVAEITGKTWADVLRTRNLLNIPPLRKGCRILKPEEIKLLGTDTDLNISKILNMSVNNVAAERKKNGINPVKKEIRAWTPEELKLFDDKKLTNQEIAEMIDRTITSVAYRKYLYKKNKKESLKRSSKTLPSVASKKWTQEEIDLLGTCLDSDVAKKTGRTKIAIRSKRRKLGIKPFFDVPNGMLLVPDHEKANYTVVPLSFVEEMKEEFSREKKEMFEEFKEMLAIANTQKEIQKTINSQKKSWFRFF